MRQRNLGENRSLMRVVWVLSTVAVTFKNNNSYLMEESSKEQLGVITVRCPSHRKAAVCLCQGYGKTGNLLKCLTSQLILKLKDKRKNKLSLSSVCLRS